MTRQAVLVAGNSYSFTLVTRSNRTVAIRIWADFNHNAQYEASGIISSTTTGTSNFVTGLISIPANTIAGLLAVRVMVNESYDAPHQFLWWIFKG